MKRLVTTLSCLLVAGLFLGDATAWAQQVYVTQDIKHDTSPPMRDILRNLPAAAFGNVPYAVPNRFEPFSERKGRLGEGPDTPDALRQEANGPLAATVGVNVQGLSDDDNAATVGFRVVPPDTEGDVGVDYYVQFINLIWAVYQKSDGVRVSGPNPGNSFWSGFGGSCQANNDGDPIVLYDHLAGRWVFSQFSINQGIQCVAVSTTGDPLGPYHRYAFVVTPGGQNDYPKMGVWTDGAGQSAYTFTTRDFGVSGFIGSGVMERDAMLTGASAQFVKFQNPCNISDCLEGTLPPHLEGPPPPAGTCPTFFTYYDANYDDGPSGVDGVRNHTLCVDWNNIANSTYGENALATSLSSFDRFLGSGFSDCISPVLGGEVLDCLAAFTMYRAQYRWWGTYASVVLNTTVDADATNRAGIRWGELRSSDGETGWGFHQEGTYALADGSERWMGSIAMNGNRDIALGFSRTSGSEFPSIQFTGQTVDQSGTGNMNVAETQIIAGGGAQVGSSNRWGDYSALSVDPVDDETFWYTTEYYENTNSFDFKTRIASFVLGATPTNDPPTASFTFVTDNLMVDFTDTSTDSDGSIVSWDWDFDDGNTSTAQNPSHTYAAAGTYSVSLTVTDDGGATDTATQDVTVTDGGSNTMHVHDSIAQGTTGNGKNKNGTATVTIYNESESAVANATVTVVFSGSFNETVSGTTDASGVVTVVTLAKAKNPVFSTCVDDVTHASLTYDPFVNEDPNADCNGGGTPPTDVHVEDITTSTQGGGPNKRGRATVAVFDDLGNPAVGYVVAGTFSGSYTETKTGTTGSDGQVTLTTSGRVATPEFEFCVDSVTGALPYNSSANVVTCASYPPPAAAAKGAVAGETPEGYALDQNYPNPFNPATVITYSLAEAGPVTLKVYNVLGQEVATLVDGFEEAGSHRVGFEAAHLSAGVYLYVIEAEGFTDTRRMTLLK